jgi:hypothetical protein
MLNRRSFLTSAAGSLLGVSVLGASGAKPLGKKLILLWMEGGPSQLDTFDPKPGTDHGGPFASLETAVSGIRISEHLPNVAREMKSIALIRSMTSKEGNHPRARYLLHTGYPPSGSVRHPGIGSVVSHELGKEEQPMPTFVSIGGFPIGSGFLGTRCAPFMLQEAGKVHPNIEPPAGVDGERQSRRLRVLQKLDDGFKERAPEWTEAHAIARDKALAMMRSEEAKAFDIQREPEKVRASYGDTAFGKGVLMARRLIEAGVEAVEVSLKGWDTHEDNFDRVKDLCAELDPAMSSLVRDLRERGLLDDTLVVWMGEFGRTPRVNPRKGRDHFPKAYSVALAGCGIRGGQAVGATSKDGTELLERPVLVPDLFATIYQCLGVKRDRVFSTPQGRPISIVAEGGAPIRELV